MKTQKAPDQIAVKKAQELAKALGLNAGVDALAAAAKLSLVPLPASAAKANALVRVDAKGTLAVNNKLSIPIQRFLAAVGLGHCVLGHVREGQPLLVTNTDLRENPDNPLSQTAQEFAAELLMPCAELKAALANNPSIDLVQLAQQFNVTAVLMRWRLKQVAHG